MNLAVSSKAYAKEITDPENNEFPGKKHSRSSDIKISLKIAARRYATQRWYVRSAPTKKNQIEQE